MLRLTGAWQLQQLTTIWPKLAALELAGPLQVHGEGITAFDSAGALALLQRLWDGHVPSAQVSWHGFTAAQRRTIDSVRHQCASAADVDVRDPTPPLPHPERFLAFIGRRSQEIARLSAAQVNFLGRTAAALAELIRHPGRLRVRELTAQLEQVLLNAIPVVVLVTLLIGVVFAYLLGLQAEQYGANIFVVDGVAIGMSREFAPIIVAVIIAGRSGAAFTAQLGSMKLTEETDAIRTLGLDPMQVLVTPRVLALIIAMPLLSFVGLVAGLGGAMLVADAMLAVSPPSFVERLQVALDIRHVWAGLVKAPFFALFIAMIGCRMGMYVGRDTRAVGLATTSTVVQSIVSVILLDAAFAVFFQALEI